MDWIDKLAECVMSKPLSADLAALLEATHETHCQYKAHGARRDETMAWVADKLSRLEKNIEYDLATCRELRHALTDNPRLKGA